MKKKEFDKIIKDNNQHYPDITGGLYLPLQFNIPNYLKKTTLPKEHENKN